MVGPEEKKAILRNELDINAKLNPTKVNNFRMKYKLKKKIG